VLAGARRLDGIQYKEDGAVAERPGSSDSGSPADAATGD
jgi:hypothetical protein